MVISVAIEAQLADMKLNKEKTTTHTHTHTDTQKKTERFEQHTRQFEAFIKQGG